ncbi:hypothetical protein [Nocardioides sp.]|uniref:hypothetical protein n=1 Tax=Nocardioides sp. TaxID=35761 RepID=UPI002732D62F|nr:hypothetical protein [Nocardioides sp.]MDP3892438.1 hypothetical protein [Nocardioides sp.]
MPHHHAVRLASALVLCGVLTACTSAGADPDADELQAPAAAIAPLEAVSESAAAKGAGRADGEAAESMSTLTSSADADAAAAYTRALGRLRPAFDRFTTDYAAAMEQMDTDAVLAAATSLRRAVARFDAAVRSLDLTGVQGHVDALLELNADFVVTLDAVGTATSGAQAVRIMEMLPFRDYVLAYDAVADAL